jgi:signal transduction histidine kinase
VRSWPSATTAQHPGGGAARIFERFHRLLGTQADGSGLGLAIVSEIATLHGARITLEEDTTASATPSACSSLSRGGALL